MDGCLTACLILQLLLLVGERGGGEPSVPQAWHSEMVFLRNDVSLTWDGKTYRVYERVGGGG